MKTFFYSAFLIVLMSCQTEPETKPVSLPENNPFNVGLNEPFDFASVTGDAVEEYVAVTIKNAEQAIETIKSQKTPTFENTFAAYDDVHNSLTIANSNAFMMFWVSTDSLTRAKGSEYSQKVESLTTSITSDKGLFNQFEKFTKTDAYSKLTGHRKRFVDDIIENFKHSGVGLEDDKLNQFKTLKAEITDLTSQYSKNMNTANAVLKLDEKGAEGLSENFKSAYKKDDGSYEVPVIPATRRPVMDNAKNAQTRKDYITAYSNRGAGKNLAILDELIKKRHQLGLLMGYRSFAEYNTVPKMVKTPENAWNFINSLVVEAKPKAIADHEVLKAARAKETRVKSDEPVNPWDILYYENQILKTDFNVDHEKIREYLPMESALQGMFELYQELLGLEFRKVQNPSVWHEEVESYEVYEDDMLKGRFYLDLYPRANKESWFYCVPLSPGKLTSKGYEVPVAMLLGNFTRATETAPSLLSHNELSTLFHEFGHIMNSMAYEGEFSIQAETKPDFVEAMSQIFENWIFDYDILSSFAKHYKTNDVLPKSLFDNMINAKNVSSGINALGSLRSCIYDMTIYDKYNPEKPMNTDDIWTAIDEQMGAVPRHIKGTHPQASWIHINTHPVYYYGYLWSEVYSQDMFTVFEANGLRDQKTGVKYRKLILGNGSQRDVVEVVEEFLGRPSNNKAYIKSLGLE